MTLVTSCAIELGTNDGLQCAEVADCPSDRSCYRGFCVLAAGGRCTEEGQETDCYTGPPGTVGVGVCAPGRRTCRAGSLSACSGETLPAIEICDQQDDDCDGLVDETLLGASEADGCTVPGAAAQDDDCDGTTDEDCACAPGEIQSCYDGPAGTAGVGACIAGSQTCERDGAATRFGPCTGALTPGAESCANGGVDDDCNGVVDDIATLGQPCAAALQGVCAAGVMTCEGGLLLCVAPLPRTETCDSVDDDCDGLTDEGFALMVDPLHCGACGRACSGGQSCCGGGCVDLHSDEHCGRCDFACHGSESCNGTCCCRSGRDCRCP